MEKVIDDSKTGVHLSIIISMDNNQWSTDNSD